MTAPIGILGGTFDPVHNGHVVLGILAMERLSMERLLVIPARESPHKVGRTAAPAEARLRLLRLAFAGVAGVEVTDLEIRRPPPSYTADTVAEVARIHPGKDLVLLLGLDALAEFPRWRNVPAIVERCRLGVFRRAADDLGGIERVKHEVPGLRAELLETPTIDISATAVRDRARRGLPLAGFVPDAVAAAIAREGLYADPAPG